ncbi:MAG: biotin--[acetyl-CoA-carboxylase] ligase [Eggerthellaceae bacterium]|nr:biotin--[acetyl-CoA-carboxylase] ligase [Eggerthellaceae bacterium]
MRPDTRAIEGRLGARAASFLDLACLDSVASTNEVVKEAIRGQAPEGRAVIAFEQTDGYGRQGRFWASPPGGLYLSLLLRPLDRGKPLQETPTLSLVLALAARNALVAQGCTFPIQLKWPNDVVCAQGKLCGISLEAVDGALCVGIGLNLFQPAQAQALDGRYIPAYAVTLMQRDDLPASAHPDGLTASQAAFYEEAAAALLSETVRLYHQWLDGGFASVRDEYQAHAALRGQTVRLLSPADGVLHEGRACGVDAQGRLSLLDARGSVTPVHSGEVHLI